MTNSRFWLASLPILLASANLYAQHSAESVELAKNIPITARASDSLAAF